MYPRFLWRLWHGWKFYLTNSFHHRHIFILTHAFQHEIKAPFCVRQWARFLNPIPLSLLAYGFMEEKVIAALIDFDGGERVFFELM